MLAIFGSGAGAENAGIYSMPIVKILVVLLAIFIFIKFCGWAKKFQLSAGVKKAIFILTGVGLIVFNVLYSMGNKAILAGNGWGGASIAVVASLVWVFIFAFALMTETKA
ncbi:MAG TPA: hypothetical protein VHQ70_00995 [Syntrophomonadaceae bacterium]|nr:hypothetical protein [Syntrophomonadaceae bacterium]